MGDFPDMFGTISFKKRLQRAETDKLTHGSANESAQQSGKKTISPQDVMAAMKDCEFDDFQPRLEAELKST